MVYPVLRSASASDEPAVGFDDDEKESVKPGGSQGPWHACATKSLPFDIGWIPADFIWPKFLSSDMLGFCGAHDHDQTSTGQVSRKTGLC